MRPPLSILFLLPAWLLVLAGCRRCPEALPHRADSRRVACVGDSVTFGAYLPNRATQAYPAQLNDLLGEPWEVRNFGVGGASMIDHGHKPIRRQCAFEHLVAFDPEVIIIMLGTNDSKTAYEPFLDTFFEDYCAFIARLRDLTAAKQIWVCFPPPAYAPYGGISDAAIRHRIIPDLRRVSEKMAVELVDTYTPLKRPSYFLDTIHPTPEGHRRLAEVIAEQFKKAAARD